MVIQLESEAALRYLVLLWEQPCQNMMTHEVKKGYLGPPLATAGAVSAGCAGATSAAWAAGLAAGALAAAEVARALPSLSLSAYVRGADGSSGFCNRF